MRVLITGASGYVGRALSAALRPEHEVVAAVRSTERAAVLPAGVSAVVVPDVGPTTDWSIALEGVWGVVHLAARVHVLRETEEHPAEAFRRVNVHGTETLARAAAAAGVSRFVFLSSVGIHGSGSGGRPVEEDDPPRPVNDYAASKWDAERRLHRVKEVFPMAVSTLRAPMVYGASAPGNFGRLLRLVRSGVPLPFGLVENRRSFIAVGNLVAALRHVLRPDLHAAGTYFVSDGRDWSTPGFVAAMARGLGRRPRLLPVPPRLLAVAARLVGRTREMDQLLGSLVVSTERARQQLGFVPPLDSEQAIIEAARASLATAKD